MWGSNKYGQLGLQDYEVRTVPTQVELEFNPMNLECGFNFTIAQDFSNKLYSCGKKDNLGYQMNNNINAFD